LFFKGMGRGRQGIMDSVGWLIFALGALVVLLILLAAVIAIALNVSRKRKASLELVSGAQGEVWPPPPVLQAPEVDEISEPPKPRTPYFAVIVLIWGMFLAQVVFEVLGNYIGASIFQYGSVALGIFLVTRNDRAATINGTAVLLIFIRYIIESA